MAKVYVVQLQPGKDYNPAMKFGDLVPVFQPSAQVYAGTQDYVDISRRKLANATPDDYFLPVGDPLLICTAFYEMAVRNDGFVRVLKWDKKAGNGGDYIEVAINVEGQPE